MSSAAEHFSSLIRRVAEARDQTAFATLFDHFAPRLKSYLVRLGTDATEAEELAQEVMITLWRKAHLFDPGRASPSTWLFRIARNRRIDALRRDRSSEIDIDDPGLRPAAPDDADDLIDARTREERVRAALADLPDDQADLVRRAFFLGRSHSQIAEETGVPLGTVKSRIRLAFAKLRKRFEDDAAVDTD
ncbi:sigma-70 family RNA polymerase sigma factor [Stappia sp.]|uniref:sigma-70 family RNA polymerase sigma factor n=1 Tax=Stappia sp. TaxID=1870903 RepID=UPI003A99EACE